MQVTPLPPPTTEWNGVCKSALGRRSDKALRSMAGLPHVLERGRVALWCAVCFNCVFSYFAESRSYPFTAAQFFPFIKS